MVNGTQIKKLLVGAGILVGIAGCAGSTDGGSAGNDSGTPFVADAGSVGTIKLELDSANLSVGQSADFHVSVKAADGTPVAGVRVSCDTEKGVALIEPNTGTEITGSSGAVSGVFGCEKPGSYQMACRLPVGGNLRDFAGVRCSGPVPAGFTGFTGAGGGGLGGKTGGTISGQLSIKSIVINDGGQDNTRDIDIVQSCPDVSQNEEFTDSVVEITVQNDSSSSVTFDTLKVVAPLENGSGGTFRSPAIALSSQDGAAIAPGDSATYSTIFAYPKSGGTKSLVGTTADLDAAVSNVVFTISGEAAGGDTVQLSGTVALSFNNWLRECSGQSTAPSPTPTP